MWYEFVKLLRKSPGLFLNTFHSMFAMHLDGKSVEKEPRAHSQCFCPLSGCFSPLCERVMGSVLAALCVCLATESV